MDPGGLMLNVNGVVKMNISVVSFKFECIYVKNIVIDIRIDI